MAYGGSRGDIRLRPTKAQLNRFRYVKDAVNREALAAIKRGLANIDYSDIAVARDDTIRLMNAVLTDSTDAIAVLSANFYDECRVQAGLGRTGALAINERDAAATEAAVRGLIQSVIDNGGDPSAFESLVLDRAGYELKKASSKCIYSNGKRDKYKVLYEWTPGGSGTCEFCRELCDLGAVSYSSQLDHFHANCRCEPVPVWDL